MVPWAHRGEFHKLTSCDLGSHAHFKDLKALDKKPFLPSRAKGLVGPMGITAATQGTDPEASSVALRDPKYLFARDLKTLMGLWLDAYS